MASSPPESRPPSLARLRPKLSSYTPARRPSMRFFRRSSSVVLPHDTHSSFQDTPSKKSFLSKSPVLRPAKKVLAILREQKQSAHSTLSSSRNPPTETHSSSSPPLRDDCTNETPTSAAGARNTTSPIGSNAREQSSLESSFAASVDTPNHSPPPVDVASSDVSEDFANSFNAARGRPVSPNVSTSAKPPSHKRSSHLHNNDLPFIDDVGPHGVSFTPVGEEEHTVPEAPSSKIENDRFAPYDQPIRALQMELDSLRVDKEQMGATLQQHDRQRNILLNSLRTRAEESSAEVEQLSRQLKDTRKRLSCRIRELEEEADIQTKRHAEQIEYHLALEIQLRAEIDRLRGATTEQEGRNASTQRFVRTESSPLLTARRKRALARATHDASITNSRASTGTDFNSSGAHSGVHPNFARVRSAGNVYETARRPASRFDVRRPPSRTTTFNRRGTPASLEVGAVSAKTLARRSLLRRSFIAHIHSSRYRSTRAVWNDFFGAENEQITPEQFSRAVRGLAIAADAHDRDLELLRQEVSGAEENDTGVMTWEMFVRFYSITKHESVC